MEALQNGGVMATRKRSSPRKQKGGSGGRNIIMVMLVIIAAVAIIVAILAVTSRDRTREPVQTAAHVSVQETTTEPETLTDRIALPQFAWLDLKADVTEQSLTFDNPAQNYAAFRVAIVLDGETLWESETLRPGDTSASVVLSRPLAAGDYEANLVYTCFTNDEAQNPLNGADSPITLKVN